MSKWFGEPWWSPERRAPVCANDEDRVPVPIGHACMFCNFPIEPKDRGILMPHMSALEVSVQPVHIACLVNNVMGGKR